MKIYLQYSIGLYGRSKNVYTHELSMSDITCGTRIHFEHVRVDIGGLEAVRIKEAEILFAQTDRCRRLDGFTVLAHPERRVRQQKAEGDALHWLRGGQRCERHRCGRLDAIAAVHSLHPHHGGRNR